MGDKSIMGNVQPLGTYLSYIGLICGPETCDPNLNISMDISYNASGYTL